MEKVDPKLSNSQPQLKFADAYKKACNARSLPVRREDDLTIAVLLCTPFIPRSIHYINIQEKLDYALTT